MLKVKETALLDADKKVNDMQEECASVEKLRNENQALGKQLAAKEVSLQKACGSFSWLSLFPPIVDLNGIARMFPRIVDRWPRQVKGETLQSLQSLLSLTEGLLSMIVGVSFTKLSLRGNSVRFWNPAIRGQNAT